MSRPELSQSNWREAVVRAIAMLPPELSSEVSYRDKDENTRIVIVGNTLAWVWVQLDQDVVRFNWYEIGFGCDFDDLVWELVQEILELMYVHRVVAKIPGFDGQEHVYAYSGKPEPILVAGMQLLAPMGLEQTAAPPVKRSLLAHRQIVASQSRLAVAVSRIREALRQALSRCPSATC